MLVTCVYSGQKVLEPLELEVQTAICFCVGARNETQEILEEQPVFLTTSLSLQPKYVLFKNWNIYFIILLLTHMI